MLEWVNAEDAPIDKGQWTDAFEVEPIDELDDKISQMHSALKNLTDNESFDIVQTPRMAWSPGEYSI